MSSPSVDVAELRRRVNEQAESIKALKKSKAAQPGGAKKDDPEIMAAVAALQGLKAAVAAAEQGDPEEQARLAAARVAKEKELATRRDLDAVLTQRGFFFPSNEIHQAPSGFFDFGPVGCAIKQNLLALWRSWFVHYESMLEIECPAMTPATVFQSVQSTANYAESEQQGGGRCGGSRRLLR